ncbi:MAG: hypothetical protein K8S55_00830 [Phycisphaerae bacterium]|nr:hypothetical protein [Phycisphaerae bacterium]
MKKWIVILLWVAICFGPVIETLAQDAAKDTPRRKRYTDELNGFSIRPPVGWARISKPRTSFLARWIREDVDPGKNPLAKEDPQTINACWKMTVFKSGSRRKLASLEQCAKSLKAEICRKEPSAKVDPPQIISLAGCRTIEIAGTITGEIRKLPGGRIYETKWLFRQAWLEVKPGQFLILKLEALAGDKGKKKFQATWKQFAESLQLSDPAEALAKQKTTIQRSQKFLLEDLTPEKLHAALPAKALWFLILQNKQPVGWYCFKAGAFRREGLPGYRIRSWSMLQPPKSKAQLVRRILFIDKEMKMESWRVHVQIGFGPTAEMIVEDGLRQRGVIFTSFSKHQAQQKTSSKRMPKNVKNIYLPKLAGMLLPRLIDRSKKAAYIFAAYSGAINDFNMRTVKILGPENIQHNDLIVKATKATDQPFVGAETTTLWLDADGNPLWAKSPDGTITEATSRKKILQQFPKAEIIIRKMNQAEAKACKHILKDDCRPIRSR